MSSSRNIDKRIPQITNFLKIKSCPKNKSHYKIQPTNLQVQVCEAWSKYSVYSKADDTWGRWCLWCRNVHVAEQTRSLLTTILWYEREDTVYNSYIELPVATQHR